MKNDANLVYLMDLLDNECIAGVAAIIIAEMLAIVWKRLNSYFKCGTIGGVLEGRDAPLFLVYKKESEIKDGNPDSLFLDYYLIKIVYNVVSEKSSSYTTSPFLSLLK